MSKGRGPWPDGRRAWQRLAEWQGCGAHRDTGEDALAALGDIGLVRRLLDSAELEAVRTARRHRRSWAEIATTLGVTRQSAWERWRDLDDADDELPAAPGAQPQPGEAAVQRAVVEVSRRARELRRRASVIVPNVVGRTVDEAREVLIDAGLVASSPDPDGPPLPIGEYGTVVTDQSPESGAKVPRGAQVRLWTERGGGSGVREPRRPRPVPREGRAMSDELGDAPADRAVG